ncbi:unnamed protein product, partial [Rotaria sordida]
MLLPSPRRDGSGA